MVIKYIGINGFFDNVVYNASTKDGVLRTFDQLEKATLTYFRAKANDLLHLIKTQKELKLDDMDAIGRMFNTFCSEFFLIV